MERAVKCATKDMPAEIVVSHAMMRVTNRRDVRVMGDEVVLNPGFFHAMI